MADERGLVFNIQRFSVHDGPGIRTTVFMKGCSLRCWWCSNPESRSYVPQLMVRDINCTGCGACVEACPRGAITLTVEEGRKIERSVCDECLLCVDSCLYQSLNRCGTYMTVDGVVDEVMRDDPFYKNSGGGVTVSGGEPLSQSGFVTRVLAECKKKGLHTTLDTSGLASWEDMAPVLEWTDLVLFDIKHLDGDRHLAATGVKNTLILENLRKAATMSSIWLRVPLIEGFNDSEEHMHRIAQLASKIGVGKISLLPYHEGGRSKAGQLGISSPFPKGAAPDDRHSTKLAGIAAAMGVKVSTGV